MNDLDPTGQGVLETYERKMEVIKARYSELGPKAVVSRLLGADVNMGAGDDETVTGETGGKLLLSYLFSVKDKEAWLRLPASRRGSRRRSPSTRCSQRRRRASSRPSPSSPSSSAA